MPSRPIPLLRAMTVLLLTVGVLSTAACAPEETGPAPSATSPSPLETEGVDASPSPTPTASPSAASVAVPTDCRAILSEAVLAQLDATPLNPDNFGPVGVQPDGSLICLWRDPGADTTYLQTTIERMNSGPALDLLNALVNEQGFTCFTPDGGTRCEKTWQNTQYPVTDGRTLFYRDDILIDTSYSNLAPSGYTDSIVQHLFSD